MKRKLARITTLAVTTAAAAAVAIPTTTAAADVNPLIVGGREATEHYSWMASIQLKDHPATHEKGFHGCAAVAVEPFKLVTAGHCVSRPATPAETAETGKTGPVPMPIEEMQVMVGSHDRKDPDRDHYYEIARAEYHENWRYTPGDDVAVIYTTRPMIGITPIKISTGDAPRNAQRRILGWGVTSGGMPAPGDSSNNPRFLQEQAAALVDDAKCAPGTDMGLVPGKEKCVGQPDTDNTGACFGDSGGPLIVRNWLGDWMLEGITSRGPSPKECGVTSGIFTDATFYKSWIDAH